MRTEHYHTTNVFILFLARAHAALASDITTIFAMCSASHGLQKRGGEEAVYVKCAGSLPRRNACKVTWHCPAIPGCLGLNSRHLSAAKGKPFLFAGRLHSVLSCSFLKPPQHQAQTCNFSHSNKT